MAALRDEIRQALADGHCFRAYDTCRDALARHPDDLGLRLLAALTSLHCGDVAEAQAVVGQLSASVSSAGEAELVAEIGYEAWRREGATDDLLLASEMAGRAFRLDPGGARAVLAAVLAEICGRQGEALSYAAQAVRFADVQDDFSIAVRVGLQALLQGEPEAAFSAFSAAGAASRGRYALRIPVRRELAELAAAGLALPAGIDAVLPAPTVVLFSGPQIDLPDSAARCFPEELADRVAAQIASQLERMGAEIGYACAAPGADLLFIEAMLARGAEINIVLPCTVEDFITHWVRPAGARWETLFHRVLAQAASVTLTATDPLFFDAVVLQCNNRIIDGIARLRARALGCKPYLLAVWDYNLPSQPGSVADFIDHWGDPARLRMIDLDAVREDSGVVIDQVVPLPAMRGTIPADYPQRVVRAMLFADIVGYSRLTEVDLPAFWRYMEALATHLAAHAPPPALVESWGDALYVVQDSLRGMADYALALQTAFNILDSGAFGLPEKLQIRIGLHAGPVFFGHHPLTGREIIYGSQVTRAARIEPIGTPGKIYVSEQFVAALVAGESLREEKTEAAETLSSDYAFEYLGTLELAKNYGRQAVYLLRPGTVRQ